MFGRLRYGPPREANNRLVRTWREGEVGLSGTRIVATDGGVTIQGRRYQSPVLARFADDVVYFHTADDEPLVSFHVATWSPPDLKGHQTVGPGQHLCTLEPV
jgi:hypothetical protein